MVEQSLLRQAADRGVTICFADLDGADGLWVPEERTVLVNRGLSDAQAAEVIEHELTHVMIDDQHADLDAGKDVLAGHPPTRSWRRPETITLAAAVGLVAVVGGVMYGVNTARNHDTKFERVAPTNPPGLTASESADGTSSPRVFVTKGADGRWHTFMATATAPAPAPTATASATASPTASATVTKRLPGPVPSRTTLPSPTPPSASATPPPSSRPTTEPPPTTPPVDPVTVPPTSQAAPSVGVGNTGNQGGGGASDPPGPTQPATVANNSMAAPASDLAPAGGAVESTADSPAGGALDGTPGSSTSR